VAIIIPETYKYMSAIVAQPPAAEAEGTKSVTPNDFVHSIVGKSVIVKLNSGVCYHGVLACLDGFMNLALESCEEYVDGQRTKSFGDCFIRGNNVLYLSAKK
jgi:U6 snRNA-associated Sm-like protein LSm6|tara:strand:+ start:1693 stop:1998 length:306 start_codon:yes stop_codon:yes gene_type:complete